VIAVMIWRTGQYSPFLYRGGLVLLSFASAAVIAAVAVPSALTGRVLGCRPLRWLGVRSYGIYLWHYPVIVLTTPANATEDLARAGWQTAVTIVVAAVSWRYIEEPIRRGALARLWKQIRVTTARPAGAHAAPKARRADALPTALAAVGAAAVLVTASAGLSGAFSAPAATNVGSLAGSTLPAAPADHAAGAQPAAARAGNKLSPSGSATALHTSCKAVAHLGDSTSEGMVSAAYLANPNERLVAQYHDVGVRKVITNIVGANSIVETLPGDTNGYNAAKDIVQQGYKGCWVIALGTNDAADVAIGSAVGPAQRIQEIMSVAHGSPVLWVNVVSTLNSGPYAESSMQVWNTALNKACAKYPNMRIFNWASLVQPSWFISDGIHYTSVGYAQRSEQIADALAKAFPAKGHSSGCTVS
jgi:lysophospholipase L1-like esterase